MLHFNIFTDYCPGIQNRNVTNGDVITIRSPLFPAPYPNNMNCRWVINNAENIEKPFLVVTFESLTLDGVDKLELGFGSDFNQGDVMTMNGHMPENGFPNSITMNSTRMWIIFQSDKEKRALGFVIDIEAVEYYGKYLLRKNILT